jgi:hypothetical protein
MSICVSFSVNDLVRLLFNVETHGLTYRGKLILRSFGMSSESHIPLRSSHKYSFNIPINLKSERTFLWPIRSTAT